MATNQNFIQEFERSLAKLNQLNEIIQKNTQDKKAFSDMIIAKLGEINNKIKDIAGKIRDFKNQVDGLQSQVQKNTSGISDKDKQIQQLKQQLQTITTEKNNLQKQLEDLSLKSVGETNKMFQRKNRVYFYGIIEKVRS
jgi:chromosome segregation ATPase